MGNKLVPDDEKKTGIKLSIRKKDIEELKERNVNISELAQNCIDNYLKNVKK